MPNAKQVKLFDLFIDAGQIATGLNQTMELLQKFSGFVGGVIEGIVGGVQKAISAIQRIGASIANLAGQSARLDSMRDSFNKMTAGFGESGQDLIKAMRDATLGMTGDADLMQSSMTGMMLISKEAMGDVAETLPMFAKIATAAARALGEDVGFMYDSLVRGIGRASPMILDNLGFTIRLGEVYGNMADQLGKNVKELTTVERQQALVSEVMRLGISYVENLGISTGGLATKQKQLRAEMVNFKDTIGQAVMPLWQALQGLYIDVAQTVISKLIPAFRTLGRVFSEVFGVKNPFARWVEGDQVGQTTKRIEDLQQSLTDLKDWGPDFAGAVTEAWEEYNEKLGELQEKYGPRIAKVEADLAERIGEIWADYEKSKARKDEDNQQEEARRLEDHKEKLVEIENRYTYQIDEAVRKRDARALLNLLRRQEEESSETKENFEKESQRRQDDREKEALRAKEDAEEREQDAKKSAAKQMAAIGEEFAKEAAKIAKERDKALDAANKAFEAETKGLEAQIEKQKELREKQIKEAAEMQAELDQPLSPVWQKFKEILDEIWSRLQGIRNFILAFLGEDIPPEADMLGENFSVVGDKVARIKDKIREVWDFIVQAVADIREKIELVVGVVKSIISGDTEGLEDLGIDLSSGIGKTLAQIIELRDIIVNTIAKVSEGLDIILPILSDLYGDDVKELFGALKEFVKEYLPTLLELLKILGPILGVTIIAAIILLGSALKAILRGLIVVIEWITKFARDIRTVIEGARNVIVGFIEIISGLFTGNLDRMTDGGQKFGEGMREIFSGIFAMIKDSLVSFIDFVIEVLGGFVEGIIEIVTGIWDKLVRHSIIPEMLQGIIDAVQGFITNILQIWQGGWDGFVEIVSNIWDRIKEIISSITGGITDMLTSWTGGLGESLSGLFTPIENIIGKVGEFAGSFGGGGNLNMNANNWQIFGGGSSQDVASQVYSAVTDVVTGASRYTRQVTGNYRR